MQGWARLREGLPQDLVVDTVVDMPHEDSVGADVVPGQRGHCLLYLFAELGRRVADPADDGLASEPQKPVLLSGTLVSGNDLGGCVHGVEQVADDLAGCSWLVWSAHSGSASDRMSSSRSVRPRALTTSTERSSSR